MPPPAHRGNVPATPPCGCDSGTPADRPAVPARSRPAPRPTAAPGVRSSRRADCGPAGAARWRAPPALIHPVPLRPPAGDSGVAPARGQSPPPSGPRAGRAPDPTLPVATASRCRTEGTARRRSATRSAVRVHRPCAACCASRSTAKQFRVRAAKPVPLRQAAARAALPDRRRTAPAHLPAGCHRPAGTGHHPPPPAPRPTRRRRRTPTGCARPRAGRARPS